MSTIQKKLIVPGQISATVATFYTVPTGIDTTITNCLLVNTTANVITVDLYLVQSGGSAGVSNQAIEVKVPANSTRAVYEVVNASMASGDTFEASASVGASVTLHLSGKETTN